MGIACDVVTCKNNLGEFCNKVDIYISEAETGEPLCQDAEFENEENTEREDKNMIITGMAHFQSVCKKKLVEWYNSQEQNEKIDLSNVFIVWSCKTLQNYKCLASTTVSGDGIYAEYTYNGDRQELYEDIYHKVKNTCHVEE